VRNIGNQLFSWIPARGLSALGFGILGNCSMRCPTSCVHVVVRRTRFLFLTELYLVHPWTRTAYFPVGVGRNNGITQSFPGLTTRMYPNAH